MKLLVMINQMPWNEEILRAGTYTKTGGNRITHRGLVLLHTSKTRIDKLGVQELLGAYDTPEDREKVREFIATTPRDAIVGCALFACFEDEGMYTYLLKKAKRFRTPIRHVSKSGPVRFYSRTVSPTIERELRHCGMWREAQKADRDGDKS